MHIDHYHQELFVCFVLGLIVQSTWAADVASEQDYMQEFPIVLSASRLSQPLSEAPNAMTVINRKMIEASGFRKITDLFKLVPGMYVSYYDGNQAVVSYHGAFTQTAPGMQVLIDGRSVYMPPFNIVDWPLLPITIDDIERIEVIRGPAAASYGENSVRGVINIITRDAEAMQGVSVSNTRGSGGINDATMHFGHHGGKLDYHATLGYSADNGYDDLTVPPNNLTLAQGYNVLNNTYDNNQARLANVRASYHLNPLDDINVQLGFNHDIMGVGFWDSSIDKKHDMPVFENVQQLEWVRRADASSEFSVRYYHIQHDTSENYIVSGAQPYAVSDTIRSGRNEIEVQHILQTAVSNRLVYGGGYRRDQVDVASTDANTNNPPPYAAAASFSFTEYRLFANDEWRYSQKLLVNAGGMLEKDAMGNHTFSPRISLNYHINPEHTLRFGSSIAHRTPSLGETNANQADLYQIGYLYEPAARPTSIGLEPEKILSREIGYLAELREWNTSIDLRLFSDQMSDLIYQLPNVGLWSNGVVANYRGEEATIKHAFSERSDLTFNCSTMVVNDNSVLLSAGQTNSVASSLPRTIANFLYSQRMADDISFSAAWYFQTSMVGLDRGPTDFQPTHRRVDVRLSRNFRGSNGMNSEVSAVVQNLFQTDYTEYIATALNNRRAFATLTLHWQ